jgi:hypothetical protein
MLAVLENNENHAWFDGMFKPRGEDIFESRRLLGQLGPLSPTQVEGQEVWRANVYRLRGMLSRRHHVKINTNGQVLDFGAQTTGNACTCAQIQQSLDVSSRSIHSNYFEWHGTGACCASFWDVDISHLDEVALKSANYLLLSENKLVCALLYRQEEDRPDIYKVITSGEMATTSTAPQWVVHPKGSVSQDILVELPELSVNSEPIWV